MVEQRDAHRPGWVPVCDSVSRPTFKFENLIEGDEYVFRAAANNRYGTGEFLQSEIVTCRSLTSRTFFGFLYLDIFCFLCNLGHSNVKSGVVTCSNIFFFIQMFLDLLVVQLSLMFLVMA